MEASAPVYAPRMFLLQILYATLCPYHSLLNKDKNNLTPPPPPKKKEKKKNTPIVALTISIRARPDWNSNPSGIPRGSVVKCRPRASLYPLAFGRSVFGQDTAELWH